MKVNDGRRLGHEALEQIRITCVQRVEAGENPEEVIKSVGFERVCIYRWLSAYRMGGLEALRAKKLFGRPAKITGQQMQQLFQILANDTPLQHKFAFALWTCSIIREILKKKFGVHLSEVSIGRLLKKLGLTRQKPLFRAYQQDPEKVKVYLETEYPKIKKLAKKCNASIYFGDEASIRSDYHSGTTWAPRGETPIVKTTGARFRVNMISAVSAKGEMRFMLTEKSTTSEVFIEFLSRLRPGTENPVFLVLDGHSVHKSKKVKDYVDSLDGKLVLFFLPAYSPELNPDENVWGYVKHHIVGKKIVTGPDQFYALVLGALRRLQNLPKVIRNIFLSTNLRYAM
ncbi:MAG TPA: IS630 family transposase [Rectinemataceae bacterium]|nr:IS630 family transposase [Rectinemataceae bacterium]